MSTEQLTISQSLAQKLHPRHYTAMSGKMAAIVAYILGEHWTEPGLAELAITGDGFVLAREEGDVGCNNWIGDVSDLERNVRNLLAVAELTPEERREWDANYRSKVTNWRP